MLTFRQIPESEIQGDNYRVAAQIYRSLAPQIEKHGVVFKQHEIEGMGEDQYAILLLSTGKQFFVCEYLLPSPPITVIYISYDSERKAQDLKDITEVLGLNYTEFDWICPDIKFQL